MNEPTAQQFARVSEIQDQVWDQLEMEVSGCPCCGANTGLSDLENGFFFFAGEDHEQDLLERAVALVVLSEFSAEDVAGVLQRNGCSQIGDQLLQANV